MSDEPKKIIVDVAGAMDKITPEFMEKMAPLLTQPMIAMLEKDNTALRARLEAVEKERDARDEQMQDILRKQECACGYDKPTDVCLGHHAATMALRRLDIARAERAEAALHGPIVPLTQTDLANIVAHLSPELEPTGHLPNRNSVMMALVEAQNDHKAALATAGRDAVRLCRDIAMQALTGDADGRDIYEQIDALSNEAET